MTFKRVFSLVALASFSAGCATTGSGSDGDLFAGCPGRALAGGFIGGAAGSITAAAIEGDGNDAAIGAAFGAVALGAIGCFLWDKANDEETIAVDGPAPATLVTNEDGVSMIADAAPSQVALSAVPDTDDIQSRINEIGPVSFAFDSATLSPSGVKAVAALAEVMTSSPRQEDVLVIGHACAHGGAYYNQLLSMRRAEAVRAALTNRFGVDAARVRIEAAGEATPLRGLDEFDPQNRRVEFSVMRKSAEAGS